jgi:hypothetical protein
MKAVSPLRPSAYAGVIIVSGTLRAEPSNAILHPGTIARITNDST